MKISVQPTWIRDKMPLKVEKSYSIRNIKFMISDKLKIPMDDQMLLYKEQSLQDSYALPYYEIPEDATLDLWLLKGWK